jgi:epoxyqueuosine reductase
MMADHDFASMIKKKARELGFSSCGISDAAPFEEFIENVQKRMNHFPESKGLYEKLMPYGYPEKSAEWAKSIITCISWYGKFRIPPRLRNLVGKCYLVDGRLSYSQEYVACQQFETWLQGAGLRTCRDATTARWSAVRSGVGQFGKNNFIFTSRGSWITIHTWIVDREMEYDRPSLSILCPENCTRCIDVCPTRALQGPFMMNYGNCIARLTYRVSSLPPSELRAKTGTWLYGCDLCQDVCPLNKNRWEGERDFPGLDEFSKILTLENLSEMDDDAFIQRIYPKLWYIQKDQLWLWRCNILRAMANSKNKDYLHCIQPALKHSNENIREMAAWAYERLGSTRG